MSWRCILELGYEREAEARAVQRALAPDDAGYVESRVDGARMIAEMRAESAASLLHTIEDYLACVAVAEKAVAAAKP